MSNQITEQQVLDFLKANPGVMDRINTAPAEQTVGGMTEMAYIGKWEGMGMSLSDKKP